MKRGSHKDKKIQKLSKICTICNFYSKFYAIHRKIYAGAARRARDISELCMIERNVPFFYNVISMVIIMILSTIDITVICTSCFERINTLNPCGHFCPKQRFVLINWKFVDFGEKRSTNQNIFCLFGITFICGYGQRCPQIFI